MIINRFAGAWAFLSNFAPSPILAGDGLTYPTVEHFFQAQKTTDMSARAVIAGTGTPSLAKRAGRRVTLRADWESIKIPVMRGGLALKFAADRDCTLSRLLVATGSAGLLEGNEWGDRFWGQVGGDGQNWLGHLLMARRAELLLTR